MFKLQPNPSFWAKVPITIPGQSKPEEIELEFLYLPEDERRAQLDGKTTDEMLSLLVKDWRDVDTAFSAENFQRFLKNYPRARLDVLETYNRELYEARAKNS
jgi:hypothetical protein